MAERCRRLGTDIQSVLSRRHRGRRRTTAEAAKTISIDLPKAKARESVSRGSALAPPSCVEPGPYQRRVLQAYRKMMSQKIIVQLRHPDQSGDVFLRLHFVSSEHLLGSKSAGGQQRVGSGWADRSHAITTRVSRRTHRFI